MHYKIFNFMNVHEQTRNVQFRDNPGVSNYKKGLKLQHFCVPFFQPFFRVFLLWEKKGGICTVLYRFVQKNGTRDLTGKFGFFQFWGILPNSGDFWQKLDKPFFLGMGKWPRYFENLEILEIFSKEILKGSWEILENFTVFSRKIYENF